MTVAIGPTCSAQTAIDRALVFAQYDADMNFAMLGMQFIIAAWVFVLGACFGSFLNVVIYRLPAGMSLGKPKSRCPRCETPLAAKDNIPVFGWMLLRGKCRYCQLPIAARYPIIESVCGGIFLALLFGELLTGAANLPFRHADHFHVNPGFWLVWFAKWDLLGIYLYHCCLLIVVLATTMIGYDGHTPQKRLTAFAVIVGILGGTMWPDLRPVPGWLSYPAGFSSVVTGIEWTDAVLNPGGRYWTGVTLVGLLDGILGLLGGALFGKLVTLPASGNNNKQPLPHIAAINASFVITGVFLGWQACGMLALIALPALSGSLIVARKFSKPNGERLVAPAYFAMLLTFVLLWSRISCGLWMISFDGWKFSSLKWQADWAITIAVIAALSLGLRQAVPRQQHAALDESATGHSSDDRPSPAGENDGSETREQ